MKSLLSHRSQTSSSNSILCQFIKMFATDRGVHSVLLKTAIHLRLNHLASFSFIALEKFHRRRFFLILLTYRLWKPTQNKFNHIRRQLRWDTCSIYTKKKKMRNTSIQTSAICETTLWHDTRTRTHTIGCLRYFVSAQLQIHLRRMFRSLRRVACDAKLLLLLISIVVG